MDPEILYVVWFVVASDTQVLMIEYPLSLSRGDSPFCVYSCIPRCLQLTSYVVTWFEKEICITCV